MRVGKKYFRTRAEEARLVELWRKGTCDFQVLGKELGRTSRAIEMKLTRLGVVEVGRKISSTTTAVTSRALLTHEETLWLLAGASFYCYSKGQTSHERNLSDFKKSHDFRGAHDILRSRYSLRFLGLSDRPGRVNSLDEEVCRL